MQIWLNMVQCWRNLSPMDKYNISVEVSIVNLSFGTIRYNEYKSDFCKVKLRAP